MSVTNEMIEISQRTLERAREQALTNAQVDLVHYQLYDLRMKIFTIAFCIAAIPIGWAFSFFIVMHALAVK